MNEPARNLKSASFPQAQRNRYRTEPNAKTDKRTTPHAEQALDNDERVRNETQSSWYPTATRTTFELHVHCLSGGKKSTTFFPRFTERTVPSQNRKQYLPVMQEG
jgi:hypothetical protein